MNNDNGFDLIIDVLFTMSPQLGVLVPNSQDLVISFCLGKEETLPQSHLRALQIRSEIFMFQDKTGKNQQPHRQIHHGTMKIETFPNIHDSL